jgi:demethylmenaquinone methyltransferase / 2-methoxy-6-polyprenyl-1,4-benzoquinol methylase
MPAQQGAGASTGPSGANDSPLSAEALSGASSGRLEAGQVRVMFDRLAGVYDPMNTAMTAGLHHRWRERAAELAHVGPGDRALDVATGTGDLAIELARRVSPGGQVVGCDFAEGMLDRARAKAAALNAGLMQPRFEWADALDLPYADGLFDAATVGFGARNFTDLARGLKEMVRVVRPGGRVVVLEITTPTKVPLSLFYSLWFDRVVPALGRLAALIVRSGQWSRKTPSGSAFAAAYTYLPNSVKRFPAPAVLAAEMERAGLEDIGYLLTAGGIIAIHSGTVPSERA